MGKSSGRTNNLTLPLEEFVKYECRDASDCEGCKNQKSSEYKFDGK